MPDLELHTASSIHAALQLELQPCGIVVDIKLPGLNGLDGVTLLRKRWPLAPADHALSAQDDRFTRNCALERGVHCFCPSPKTARTSPPPSATSCLATIKPPFPARSEQDFLTPRQCEMLELLCGGLSNKLIARELKLSDNTVRRHVQDILSYFGVPLDPKPSLKPGAGDTSGDPAGTQSHSP